MNEFEVGFGSGGVGSAEAGIGRGICPPPDMVTEVKIEGSDNKRRI